MCNDDWFRRQCNVLLTAAREDHTVRPIAFALSLYQLSVIIHISKSQHKKYISSITRYLISSPIYPSHIYHQLIITPNCQSQSLTTLQNASSQKTQTISHGNSCQPSLSHTPTFQCRFCIPKDKVAILLRFCSCGNLHGYEQGAMSVQLVGAD